MTNIRKAFLAPVLLVIFGLAAAPDAKADAFTFSGTLTPNNPLQLFSFTVSNASVVMIKGTADFDLVVSLFDPSGYLLNLAIDDRFDPVAPFMATVIDEFGNSPLLAPGRYFVGVTPLPLLPGANLDEGFFLATGFDFRDFQPNSFFSTGGNFTLQISGTGVTQAAPVPEPATLLLLGTGLAGVVAGIRRRRGYTDGTRAE